MLHVARVFGLWMVASACLTAATAQVPVQESRREAPRVSILAEGTKAETPCWILTAGEPGPTIVIVGGMHGNEPSGAAAANHWRNLVRALPSRK